MWVPSMCTVKPSVIGPGCKRLSKAIISTTTVLRYWQRQGVSLGKILRRPVDWKASSDCVRYPFSRKSRSRKFRTRSYNRGFRKSHLIFRNSFHWDTADIALGLFTTRTTRTTTNCGESIQGRLEGRRPQQPQWYSAAGDKWPMTARQTQNYYFKV